MNPENIAYIDVGIIPSLDRFKDILLMLDYKIVFLDEVTTLNEWWRVLRACIDSGFFKDKVLVVTGSASMRLRKHAELFPGRLGKGKYIEVLPLSFPELINILYNGKRISTKDLKKAFEIYKSFGGYPISLNRRKDAIADIIRSFEGEISKQGMSVEISFKIISSLLEKIPSALSYQSIGGDIGVSYKTVEVYVEAFKSLYLANVAYWKHDKKVSFRKEKKIFFRDPFILHSFSFWTGTRFLESALYENIIQEHLYRKYGEIYYYKNKYEIDAIAGDLRVEVKAGKPHRRYPKNVIVLGEEEIPRFLLQLFK